MSRITGSEAKSMMEAYSAVYAPEEQVWEEVENWVNALVEEGYDLSDYTWEDMYESYIEEQGGQGGARPINKTSGSVTTYAQPRANTQQPIQSRFARPRNAGTPQQTGTGIFDAPGMNVVSRPKIGSLPLSARQPGGPDSNRVGSYTSRFAGYRDAAFARAQNIKGSPVVGSRPIAPSPAARPSTIASGSSKPPTAPSAPAAPSRPSAPAAPSRPSAPAAPVSQRPSLAQQRSDIEAMRKRSQQRTMAQGGTPSTPLVQSFDSFDIIKGYLLDEGYADTEEAALTIMVNLSEDQKNQIIDLVKNSVLHEEEARQGSLFTRSGKPQDFRNPKKIPFTATDPTPTSASRRLPAAAPEGSKPSPGQLNIPEPKITTVPSPARKRKPSGAATDPWKQFPKKRPSQLGLPKEGPSSRLPGRTLAPAGGTSSKQALPAAGQTQRGGTLATRPISTPSSPVGSPSNPQRIYPTPVKPSAQKPTQLALPAAGQTSSSKSTPTGKSPTAAKAVKPARSGGLRKIGGKLIAPAAAALDAADEYSTQRGRGRQKGSAAAMGATKAAGGWGGASAGAKTGAALGAALGPKGALIGGLAGGIAGYYGGSEVAGRASETIAGATAKEKSAMATANRQKQAGSALKGIGGQTSFSQKKPGGPAFMSTGVGKQRKTVELAKTGVVQRGAKSTAGHLAFKGGQAVYKAGPSAQSLARTSSNPLERVGRSLFAGAYKKHDAAKAQQALAKARQSDVARNKKLGVKMKPAG